MTKTTTWMQLALNNRKIDAIKELRGLVRKDHNGQTVLTLAAAKDIVDNFMESQKETLGDILKKALEDTSTIIKAGDTVRLKEDFAGCKQGFISKVIKVQPATTDGKYLVTIKDGLQCYAHRFEKITEVSEIQTLKDKVSLLEDRFRSLTDALEELKASVVMKTEPVVEPLDWDNLYIHQIIIRSGECYRVVDIAYRVGEFKTRRISDGRIDWWLKSSLVNFTRKDNS